MSEPGFERLFAAVDATWPAAQMIAQGPMMLREGRGGGKRVSAATAEARVSVTDVREAEQGMAALGQKSLFMIRQGEEALDKLLATEGYSIVDPVAVLVAPVATFTDTPVPRLATFEIWEPLAIMAEIWEQGGIGPERIDVMRRADEKTAVLARWNQQPAGTGFVAVDAEIAMVHAVEVLPRQRRQGVAGWIMRHAAFWAQAKGATTMAVLCTKANAGALGLYESLGFVPVTKYHYRQKIDAGDLIDG